MEIFTINWFNDEEYIETDEYYFDSYETAKEYAEKEIKAVNMPYKYHIEEHKAYY